MSEGALASKFMNELHEREWMMAAQQWCHMCHPPRSGSFLFFSKCELRSPCGCKQPHRQHGMQVAQTCSLAQQPSIPASPKLHRHVTTSNQAWKCLKQRGTNVVVHSMEIESFVDLAGAPWHKSTKLVGASTVV